MSKDILNKDGSTDIQQIDLSALPEVAKALADLPEESRLKVEMHLAEYVKALLEPLCDGTPSTIKFLFVSTIGLTLVFLKLISTLFKIGSDGGSTTTI